MCDRAASRKDKSTLSNFEDVKTLDLQLNLSADFDRKALIGHVAIKCQILNPNADKLILDSKSLIIQKTTIDGNTVQITRKPHACFGIAIELPIPDALRIRDQTFTACVFYETTQESEGIQWLPKEQTADKKHPYMFTQCQAIHARSLLPCQDTPSVKCTYSADIKVPSWATCLMSAVSIGEPVKKQDSVSFHWEQKVPIPSYLIAVVIGCIRSRDIGPRTRVWSESSIVDSVAYEFAETEDFIRHGESITAQEYVWGRYDLVCLPPSFPYGGMENPCLTFVTPTLLAGDRSLADVVAHEIAHSWTGNLVTNHTWEHFWLNEGWTMWLQRKIMARMHSPKFFDFDATIGWTALKESVEMFGEDHPFTCLVPKLDDVDPDDSFSSVPYEKGFNFLYYLSRVVGEDAFERFAKGYIQEFKFKTLTTDDFKRYFLKFFSDCESDLEVIDWDGWFYNPGMPVVTPNFDKSISSAALNLADRWIAGGEGFSENDMNGWTSPQQVVMLEQILKVLGERGDSFLFPVERLTTMDTLYKLSKTKNSEIRFRWQTLCIRCNASFILPQVEAFLREQGRMKFVRPLFRDLHKSDFGRERAVSLFEEIRGNYHPIAAKMIARDIL